MSRDYANCAICDREFQIDWDEAPTDVCPRCMNRISRIIDASHRRLHAALLESAKKLGGAAQAAVEAVANAFKEET